MAMNETRRRLAAILAADVVGFSRLIQLDEDGTVAALTRHRREIIDPLIASHGGRVFKTMGDGLLAEFASVVEAVRCAVAIQEQIAHHNRELPAERRLEFRIGINMGDVLAVADDLLGDGVNIASRIEAVAAPGGVVLSDDAMRQVAGKVPFAFTDLGQHRLKNIARPLQLHALDLVRSEAPPNRNGKRELALPDRPSIAVLPFDNLSSDPAQAMLCDAIAEDIITDLSRFHSLFVIARDSSFLYRNRPADVRQIGSELGVRYLLEGSLRRAGGKIRVTVQLIETATSHHVWAERYDRNAAELFALQDEVTHAIVGRLVSRLQRADLEIARRKPPDSLQAYEYWLAATMAHELGTPDGHAEAKALYEKALAADPRYARAHAGLAELCYMELLVGAWGQPREPLLEEALQHARKSVELDESDAQPHVILGWVHMMRREFDRAVKHWAIADELNPNDAEVAMSRATAHGFLGEPEKGLEIAELAMRLNPYCPDWYLSDKAVIHFIARQYEPALAIYGSIGELYPHSALWHAAAAAMSGRLEEARGQADAFLAQARQCWAGDPKATPADQVNWLVDSLPFKREEDLAHFRDGLRRAGLPI
ncbi:MAG TPA: adenylate/guanylate cyclase domain-containing protein [Hypericibacter adhaerens]|uniref:adenylate/guanylate cyclase domain-containing protein n=1 Tax=Hypericibacter adhaerens TaxID=2602016 RepID=UPI002CF7093B|nr:adenylate/guanylate cyclase domain-containing protein [Hypericibacter adhaerens]HWA46151.1 adenylate/guanylate cyclase domain-containing protein [Hypericibacter adhaerens]